MICSKCNSIIKVNKRSLKQNAYLHLIFDKIGDELGYNMAEIKQLLKDHHGLYYLGVNKKTGEEFRVYKSTAKLTRSEFAEFTEKILFQANSQFGMNLLTPAEFWES